MQSWAPVVPYGPSSSSSWAWLRACRRSYHASPWRTTAYFCKRHTEHRHSNVTSIDPSYCMSQRNTHLPGVFQHMGMYCITVIRVGLRMKRLTPMEFWGWIYTREFPWTFQHLREKRCCENIEFSVNVLLHYPRPKRPTTHWSVSAECHKSPTQQSRSRRILPLTQGCIRATKPTWWKVIVHCMPCAMGGDTVWTGYWACMPNGCGEFDANLIEEI